MSVSQTRLRMYTVDEIPFIRGRVMVEVPKLPHYVGIRVDRDRIDRVLLDGMTRPDQFFASMLVNEDDKIVGGVCGYCVTQMLSWDKITGDVFLYIDPPYRSLPNVIKLMLAYRDWAIAQGATVIAATQTGGFKHDQLGKLLERFGGYKPIGTIYYYQQTGVTNALADLGKAS